MYFILINLYKKNLKKKLKFKNDLHFHNNK